MLALPKQQRDPDVGEISADDWATSHGDDGGLSNRAVSVAVYPPNSGGKRIQLCFRPRYPGGGVNEDAQSVLGHTMEVVHP